jgi:hypothetical protein
MVIVTKVQFGMTACEKNGSKLIKWSGIYWLPNFDIFLQVKDNFKELEVGFWLHQSLTGKGNFK